MPVWKEGRVRAAEVKLERRAGPDHIGLYENSCLRANTMLGGKY